MNRAQKVQAVEALQKTFEASETVVLAHNEGLTVAQMTELRGKMREAGGKKSTGTACHQGQQVRRSERYVQRTSCYGVF